MADDNDNSPLTRRRVLGGMATIGAAGAVGAGTWSRFKDKETKEVTVSAGDLDLRVDGNNGPIQVGIEDLANGESYKDCENLTNVGSTTGRALRFDVSEPVDHENGRSEAEIDGGDQTGAGGKGELSDYLQIRGSLECASGNCLDPDQETGWVSLSTAASAENLAVELDDALDSDGQCEFCFEVWFVDQNGDGYTSDAMGDSVDFDIDITLDQYADGEYSTSEPESTRGDTGT